MSDGYNFLIRSELVHVIKLNGPTSCKKTGTWYVWTKCPFSYFNAAFGTYPGGCKEWVAFGKLPQYRRELQMSPDYWYHVQKHWSLGYSGMPETRGRRHTPLSAESIFLTSAFQLFGYCKQSFPDLKMKNFQVYELGTLIKLMETANKGYYW